MEARTMIRRLRNSALAWFAAVVLLTLGAPALSTGGDVDDVRYFVLTGTLEVLDVPQKTAVVNGITWPLVQDFSDENISAEPPLPSRSRTSFYSNPVGVTYYVILHPAPELVFTPDIFKEDVRPSRIPSRFKARIEDVNEHGGMIYRIMVSPS
jgi:hypothetical protein